LVLHFSDFSVISYAIYKNQPLTFTIGVALLQQGPWEDFYFRNVVHGQTGRRGSPELSHSGGALGLGMGGGIQGIGRRAMTSGRRGRPWERAPAGPDAEGRRRGARVLAFWRRRCGLPLFDPVFLKNLE
jgi:hypothetical protein